MRLIRPIAAASLALAAVFTASSTGRATSVSVPEDRSPEFLRYNRMHDDSVLVELSARDVSTLPSAQRFRRTALLEELRAYRDRGVFPHNYDFPGELVPYFVDRKTGALCAVANLLSATGRRDVVDRVARANNNVWVQELAGDSTFRSWLTENGLTLEEAARIQLPARTGGPNQAQMAGMFTGAAVVGLTGLSIVSGVAITSIWNATGNADGHISKVSSIGRASGVAATALGAAIMLVPGGKSWGAMTAGAGLTSVVLSSRSMHNHDMFVAEQQAREKGTLARVSVAPVVSVGNGGSAGMSMSLTF